MLQMLNKPIYAGVSILDYAKLHMSSFWYDIKKISRRNMDPG